MAERRGHAQRRGATHRLQSVDVRIRSHKKLHADDVARKRGSMQRGVKSVGRGLVTQQVSQIGGQTGRGRLEYCGVERVPRHF